MRQWTIAALAAMLGVTPAWAQDAAVSDRVVSDRNDPVPFAGLRIEAIAGYDRVEGSYQEDDTVYYDGFDGIGVGVEIGYDLPISEKVLLGGYGAITHANQKQCDELGGAAKLCQQAGLGILAGVRLGYRAGDKVLLYLRGGYSQAELKLDYVLTGTGSASESETYYGFHGGFGGEYLLGHGLYAKGDVTRSDFRTKDRLYEGVDFQRVQAVVGVGYRF